MDRVTEEANSSPRPTGPCEECKANRQRLISLAADVVGLRRNVERLDHLDVGTLTKRVELTEWIAFGLLGYLLTTAIIEARRGRE